MKYHTFLEESDMYFAVKVILVLLNVTNIIAHTIGCYLLLSVFKTNKKNTQLVYLINLSVCEASMNFLETLRFIPESIMLSDVKTSIRSMNYTNETISLIEHVYEFSQHTQIIMYTGISFVFYLDMILLTVDRLIRVLSSTKYPIYWNARKGQIAVAISWVLAAITSITISFAHHYSDFEWKQAVFSYFYPVLDFGFILLATVTYFCIFRSYGKSAATLSQHRQSDGLNSNNRTIITATNGTHGVHGAHGVNETNSLSKKTHEKIDKKSHTCPKEKKKNIIRKPRYYIAILLILTFLLFIVVPDLIVLFYEIVNRHQSKIVLASCWLLFALGNLSDAWIYIFMFQPVKVMFYKKLGWIGKWCGCTSHGSEASSLSRGRTVTFKEGSGKTVSETTSLRQSSL